MTQKRSIFVLGHEALTIGERHGIEIPTGADLAQIITAIHDAIYERGRTFRDDLRRLAKIRRELDGTAIATDANGVGDDRHASDVIATHAD